MNNNIRPLLASAEIMANIASVIEIPYYRNMYGMPRDPFKRMIKNARSCALPGCTTVTAHNGGYCCAEHCKAHRASHRKAAASV
jgi:hypothetical protein